MSDFQEAVAYMLKNEGGFVDDPDDSGGATNFGVTIPMLVRFRQGSPVDRESIKDLTIEEARALYKAFFWDALKVDPLPQVIATGLLDCAVNRGQGNAIRCAQKALGLVAADGVPGPKTMAALQGVAVKPFAIAFVSHWINDYIGLVIAKPTDIKYLKGWVDRPLKLLSLI